MPRCGTRTSSAALCCRTMSVIFDKSLRSVAKPAFEKHGFKFDGRRKFSCILNGKDVGVEFQLGQRFMEGKFTVNLTIGEKMDRLGIVRETHLSRFINRMFGNFNPWWKGIFLPKDKWWKVSKSEAQMDRTILEVISCIERHGLPWLNRKTAT